MHGIQIKLKATATAEEGIKRIVFSSHHFVHMLLESRYKHSFSAPRKT